MPARRKACNCRRINTASVQTARLLALSSQRKIQQRSPRTTEEKKSSIGTGMEKQSKSKRSMNRGRRPKTRRRNAHGCVDNSIYINREQIRVSVYSAFGGPTGHSLQPARVIERPANWIMSNQMGQCPRAERKSSRRRWWVVAVSQSDADVVPQRTSKSGPPSAVRPREHAAAGTPAMLNPSAVRPLPATSSSSSPSYTLQRQHVLPCWSTTRPQLHHHGGRAAAEVGP